MPLWTAHLRDSLAGQDYDCVAIGRELYCFGGDVYKRDQLDVHVFDTESLRWTLATAGGGTGGSPADIPSLRMNHTVVLIEHTVYLWGGKQAEIWDDASYRAYTHQDWYYNDLYAFDADTHGWSKPEASGFAPEGRICHSACALGEVMYVHGGYRYCGPVANDTYALNTGTMAWSRINARGPPAPPTVYHSATIIGTEMFVFGGETEFFGRDHGLRVFDTTTNLWSESSVQTPDGNRYCCHSAFAYDGELYIFRCFSSKETIECLWKFNPETRTWKQVEPKGTGPSSSPFGRFSFLVRDRVIVLAKQQTNIDLFILNLNPSLRTLCELTVIQNGLSQLELPHELRRELAAMPANSESPEPRDALHT